MSPEARRALIDLARNIKRNTPRVRAKLRDGEAKISLRGYSHIFVHSADPTATNSGSEQALIDETEGIQAWQEVFDRPELRSLVESYSKKDDPSLIRAQLGPEQPWIS